MTNTDIVKLTSQELWERLLRLAKQERSSMCDLIETLVEIDRRGLYKDHEYISLFECCVHKLGLSEAAAYRRIRAARAIRLFPTIAPLLRQGRLALESVALLHPFLKDPDAAALVEAASGMRVWEVERLVASRRTEEPRRDVVRFVASVAVDPDPPAGYAPLFDSSATTPGGATDSASAPGAIACPTARLTPPSPAVRIAFTADARFFKLLKEAQAAMRHKYPNGRLDGVFRDALEALLRKKRPWAS